MPEQYAHTQWSCGSLYEFLSHICKENVANLWEEAHNNLSSNINHQKQKVDGVSVINFSLIDYYRCSKFATDIHNSFWVDNLTEFMEIRKGM